MYTALWEHRNERVFCFLTRAEEQNAPERAWLSVITLRLRFPHFHPWRRRRRLNGVTSHAYGRHSLRKPFSYGSLLLPGPEALVSWPLALPWVFFLFSFLPAFCLVIFIYSTPLHINSPRLIKPTRYDMNKTSGGWQEPTIWSCMPLYQQASIRHGPDLATVTEVAFYNR